MDISDYCLLVARTTKSNRQQEGITNFFIDTKTPGIEIRKIETLGHRGIGTTQVFYNDVKVPLDSVLGEVDNGWRAADQYLWYERLHAMGQLAQHLIMRWNTPKVESNLENLLVNFRLYRIS